MADAEEGLAVVRLVAATVVPAAASPLSRVFWLLDSLSLQNCQNCCNLSTEKKLQKYI